MYAIYFRRYLSFALLCLAISPANAAIDASGILSDIKAHGSKEVATSLWANSELWQEVITNVSQGESEWLDVAVMLRPGTDAGSSEVLDQAIFIALEHSPIAVLRLLKEQQFSVSFVCSSNIAVDYPQDQALRYIRQRIKRLKHISDRETDTVRLQCISRLRSAIKYIN